MDIKEKVSLCYQCGKCTGGCPIVSFMDYTPNRLIRVIQLDKLELALKSKTIWLCALCKTCSVRCPKNIDLASIMNKLRLMSEEKKIKPKEKGIFLFHKLFRENVLKNGRLFELALIFKYNLTIGNPFKDISIGFSLIKKGRIGLFPHKYS